MENDSNKVFIIRSVSPLDMEGDAAIEAVFFSEEKAAEKCALLNEESIAAAKVLWGDRYLKFAFTYGVETWNVSDAEQE